MQRARFFLGNDNEEYRWKYSKGSGYVVSGYPLSEPHGTSNLMLLMRPIRL